MRAAAKIAGDPDVLVLGSQSILGSYDTDELPEAAHASIEADVTFFEDYANDKSDRSTCLSGRTPISTRPSGTTPKE